MADTNGDMDADKPSISPTDGRKTKNAFNNLSPREWTLLSKSVWPAREVSSPREKHHLLHGATFSVALAERAIKMYSGRSDIILDPFLGVGTTLEAARNLGRKGIGFELYSKFADIAKQVITQKTLKENMDEFIIKNGDCRDLIGETEDNVVQLTFTSPPYANFIKKSVRDRAKTHKKSRLVFENNSVVKAYGDDTRDFGNLDYPLFLEEVGKLMTQIYRVTKPGGYNVWVVKDCRNTQNGQSLIDFHTGIANEGVKAGFKYHDLVVWDQNEQRSLVLLGYPSKFYVNINHSFLVVLRKP